MTTRTRPPPDSALESFALGRDGTRLYVRQHPGGSGGTGAPTALLCDGLVCDGYIYRYLWDDLAALMPVAHAQLQLNVPGACGNEAAFRARVDQLAGEHAVDRAEASVLVRRETRGGYRLQVTLAGAVRRSQHADCRVLVDAAALIVALSVNPALAHDPPAPEPPEPATTDSADTQEASPADEPPPARPLPMWKLAGHADVALLHGAVPAWSVPLSVGMRTSRGSFGFGLALRYIPPRESDGSLRVRVQGAGGRALAGRDAAAVAHCGLGRRRGA